MKKGIFLNLLLAVCVLLAVSCKKDKDESYRISVNKVNQIGAKVTLNISKGDGNLDPTEYGVVYSKNSAPTISDTKVIISGSSETKKLTGLDLSTTYYVRPFVTDKKGTKYYDEIQFTTACMDVDSIVPRTAAVGATVTVYGRGFGTIAGNIKISGYEPVQPNEILTTPATISNTQLTYTLPGTYTSGKVYQIGVTNFAIACNYGYAFFVYQIEADPKLVLTIQ